MSDSVRISRQEVAARKAALRTRLLAARRALPARVRAAAAERVQAALPEILQAVLPPVPEAVQPDVPEAVQPDVPEAVQPDVAAGGDRLTVAGYVPVGAEPGGPDLPAALARALGPGARVLLPVLRDDRDLDWAGYEGELVPAGRGLSEPAGPRLGPAAIGRASLLVVPALAVDHRGVRLGRGGGGYDRALARVPAGTPVVALLHDGELVGDQLPVAPHDRRVCAVVTPARGLVRLPG